MLLCRSCHRSACIANISLLQSPPDFSTALEPFRVRFLYVVLETTALPTELYPYTTGERFTNRFTRYGGEDGIRTHAALANPNDLANRPLQPLEYFSRLNVIVFGVLPNDNLRSAFGGEGGIRTHGPLRSHWFSRPAP